MDIITGYTGTPHITAENDRDINIGIFGSKSYVLQTGTMLTAEISNNNEIKVRDGVIMHQGCAASIKKNTYDSVTINNGSQGMKRIDLIVARYEKQPETNVESLTLKVLQGTPVETSPQVPAHTEGDIQAGDTVADMPLYEVEIDGLNITEIRKVFQTMGDLESVNGKSIIESGKNNNGYYRKYADGTLEIWGTSNEIGSQGAVMVTLPQPCIDTVFRIYANQIYNSSTAVSATSVQIQSKQSFYIYAREPNGTLPASSCKYNWFVVGTWK